MKIAMLTNNYKPFVGGVPISVERQAQELVKLGHEVTVFAPEYAVDKSTERSEEEANIYPQQSKADSAMAANGTIGRNENAECGNRKDSNVEYDNGIRIIRFRTGRQCMDNGMVYPRMILREITKVFEKESFDLIHTHHPMFVGPTALYLGRKYNLPVIYTYHTRYEDYLHYLDFLREDKGISELRRRMLKLGKEQVVPRYMRWFTNQCDLVLAPTAGMQKRMRENGTSTSIAVFPTGLTEEFYLEYPEEAQQIRETYLLEGGRLFCTTGRLEEEKNPQFLLQGIAKLKEKMTEHFQVLLIGDGSMREVLEREVEAMGIGDVVRFLGNIPNEQLNRYLQASDVFLFASKSETQGIVLAEAFAAGCPIVAVDASGVEDIVENGVNGYKTVEDVDVWSDKVLEVLMNQAFMKEQAKITAAGCRSSRLAVYEEMLYSQCIAKKAEMQEGMKYEYEDDGAENITDRVFRLFKTS